MCERGVTQALVLSNVEDRLSPFIEMSIIQEGAIGIRGEGTHGLEHVNLKIQIRHSNSVGSSNEIL